MITKGKMFDSFHSVIKEIYRDQSGELGVNIEVLLKWPLEVYSQDLGFDRKREWKTKKILTGSVI